MAILVNKDDTRSKLQKRVAEELAEKQKKKRLELETSRPDGVDDSAYLKNTKQTSSLGWVWVLIGGVFVGIIGWLVVASF